MGRLRGKTAIITGAGSGIGAATAHRLAREDANIVVADINAQNADRTVEEVRAAGHEAMSAVFDLSDSASIEDLVARTINRYGGFEVLFNNAAATHLGATVDKPIAEADPDIWGRRQPAGRERTHHQGSGEQHPPHRRSLGRPCRVDQQSVGLRHQPHQYER